MATSPLKARLPVPSMIVPPRITMSCMPTSRMGSRRRGRAETSFSFDEYRLTVGGKLGSWMHPSLAATLRQFPQHEKSGDSCSTLTDRPDERLNVRDGVKSRLGRRPRFLVRSGRSKQLDFVQLRMVPGSRRLTRARAAFPCYGILRIRVHR